MTLQELQPGDHIRFVEEGFCPDVVMVFVGLKEGDPNRAFVASPEEFQRCQGTSERPKGLEVKSTRAVEKAVK